MKKYTTPEIEIKAFEVETVVTTSIILTGDPKKNEYVETVSYATIFGLND